VNASSDTRFQCTHVPLFSAPPIGDEHSLDAAGYSSIYELLFNVSRQALLDEPHGMRIITKSHECQFVSGRRRWGVL
jgi:hypothetical protein